MARLADPMLAERRRRQILDAAITCFRRRGFHQATMQEICAEAQISAGALYRYFSSKADIIAAIAEDERRECDLVLKRAQGKGALLDGLCELARGFFEHAASDGALVADIMAEATRDPDMAATFERVDSAQVKLCCEALRKAQQRGEIDRTLDPTQAAHILFAALEGIALRCAWRSDKDVHAAVVQFRELARRYLAHPV